MRLYSQGQAGALQRVVRHVLPREEYEFPLPRDWKAKEVINAAMPGARVVNCAGCSTRGVNRCGKGSPGIDPFENSQACPGKILGAPPCWSRRLSERQNKHLQAKDLRRTAERCNLVLHLKAIPCLVWGTALAFQLS